VTFEVLSPPTRFDGPAGSRHLTAAGQPRLRGRRGPFRNLSHAGRREGARHERAIVFGIEYAV
jgi:hypothetical protein